MMQIIDCLLNFLQKKKKKKTSGLKISFSNYISLFGLSKWFFKEKCLKKLNEHLGYFLWNYQISFKFINIISNSTEDSNALNLSYNSKTRKIFERVLKKTR